MPSEMTEHAPSGTSTRILLVEDDPDTQALIRALCESRGVGVDIAADGFLGLRLLSERRYGIVLIDYHLPEMDGYALARLMRELARSQGQVRLVGITADQHGLASRRGADTLFDAILSKPLDPEPLFAVLDGLVPSEPVAHALPAPVDALWRRRGLSDRPRAFLCPAPSATEAEAVAQAFTLADSACDADLVLLIGESGLDGLRELRATGPAGPLPAFDLTGRLADACDGAFTVGDPDSWTALATTSLAFARRRATLSPGLTATPEARLAALLFVADRSLLLRADGHAPGAAYETGLSKMALMAAVLQLMEAGWLTCEPRPGGVAAELTQAGRDAVLRDPGPAVAGGWQAPTISESARIPGPEWPPHTVDLTRLETLEALVGARQVGALLGRLCETLDEAFATEGEIQAAGRLAHILISSAGSLGFDRVVQTCQAVQAAIAAGADPIPSLRDARLASREARDWCTRRIEAYEVRASL
jgi:CheY-like chemotaxis protein